MILARSLRSLTLVVAGGLAAMSSAVVAAAAPPDTEPPDTELPDETDETEAEPASSAEESEPEQDEDGPAVDRRDAESAFILYLSMELDVPAGTYSCSEPTSRDVGETITCFVLGDDQRVIVAQTEITETPGAFEFEIVSDFTIGAEPATTTTTSLPPTTAGSTVPMPTLPTPVIITTSVPLSQADRDLLAYGDTINRQAQSYTDNLIAGADGFVASATLSWDPATTTVTVDMTLTEEWGTNYDNAAWTLVGDQARSHWNRDSPFRAAGATITPTLVVVVNGNRYESNFDLTVEVADQTISMDDWLDASRV